MDILTLKQGIRLRQAELSTQFYTSNVQKTFMISAAFAGVVLLSGIILFNVNRPIATKASYSSTASTASSVALSSSSAIAPVMSEIHIANNGLTLVRGARITAISGDTIETTVSMNANDFTWLVATTGVTKFLDSKGQTQTISNLKVGDVLTVTGKLVKSGDQLTINAEFVRNI